jgi:hydroxymethylpyrimidine pyrophosphatase-like HAD family hydrolase
MLQAAGFSVAMGNASDEIKSAADFVTKTCEENGVAYAINRLVLNDNGDRI